MHSKDARAKGETEQRLYGISAWRETPYYTDRERAALTWAEALTACNVPDNIYLAVTAHFTDEELIDLYYSLLGSLYMDLDGVKSLQHFKNA